MKKKQQRARSTVLALRCIKSYNTSPEGQIGSRCAKGYFVEVRGFAEEVAKRRLVDRHTDEESLDETTFFSNYQNRLNAQTLKLMDS